MISQKWAPNTMGIVLDFNGPDAALAHEGTNGIGRQGWTGPSLRPGFPRQEGISGRLLTRLSPGTSSMPSVLVTARPVLQLELSIPAILSWNAPILCSFWSDCSKPFCSLLPHTVVRSGLPQLQQSPHSVNFKICSILSSGGLAASRKACQLISYFRSWP